MIRDRDYDRWLDDMDRRERASKRARSVDKDSRLLVRRASRVFAQSRRLGGRTHGR